MQQSPKISNNNNEQFDLFRNLVPSFFSGTLPLWASYWILALPTGLGFSLLMIIVCLSGYETVNLNFIRITSEIFHEGYSLNPLYFCIIVSTIPTMLTWTKLTIIIWKSGQHSAFGWKWLSRVSFLCLQLSFITWGILIGTGIYK